VTRVWAPWPDDIHIRTWPVLPGDIADVQTWTSYVNAFESYRLTDRQSESTEIINHVVNNQLRQATVAAKYMCLIYSKEVGNNTEITVLAVRYLHVWNSSLDHYLVSSVLFCVIFAVYPWESCLSVCLSVKRVICDKTKKFCPQFYTRWKIICPSFLRRRVVDGGDPFSLKLWVKLTPLERNRRFSVDIRS